MAPNTFVQRTTWLLVGLATLTFAAALWSGQVEPWVSIARLGGVVVFVAVGGWLLKDSQSGRLISASAATFLLALFLLPMITEPPSRLFLGRGEPWEIVFVTSLRNTMLGLAALGHATCQRLASVVSFFVVLFAFLLNFNWLIALLAASYLIVGMWWLIGTYWEKLHGKIPQNSRREIPKRASLLAVAAVVGLVCLTGFFVGHGPTARALPGFLPSSGGNGQAGRYAWSGIGDGVQLVSAKDDAMSFGPVDTDVFLESDMPSLYDMFDETYGGPIKPKSSERAIALTAQDRPQRDQRTAISTTTSRGFSTIREQLQRRQELEDRKSTALMYVVGRTPLHLALETYDTFDGIHWSKSATKRFISHLKVETIHDEPWVKVRSGSNSLFTDNFEAHALKIINLKTRNMPSPPHLSYVLIDKVDRADFFAWTNEGILKMPNRDHIPQLTVIHLRSLQMRQDAVHELGDFTRGFPNQVASDSKDRSQWSAPERMAYELAPYRATHDGDGRRADELSQLWSRDVPRGWAQVAAIVDQLRRGYVHDPQASAPEDCVDVVEHFLKSGRGPDYMFATTAALMLRKLGYPTRLVSGFYVRPDRYDRLARQTPVLGEDVHVWAEVAIDGAHWIPIEPTPGFEPPAKAQSWAQWATTAFWTSLSWLWANLFLGLAGVGVVVVLSMSRRSIFDFGASMAWRLFANGSVENRIRWTIWLLECRARLAGNPRPQHATLAQWYGRVGQSLATPTQGAIRSFVRVAERALYGAKHPVEDVAHLCQLAARYCHRKVFRDSIGGQT